MKINHKLKEQRLRWK